MSAHMKKRLIKVAVGIEKFQLPSTESKALLSLIKTIDKAYCPATSNRGIKWPDIYKENFNNKSQWSICLKAAQCKNSLSQKELSKKSGIPITTISKYENGERSISSIQAKKLAKILKTSYKIFLVRNEEK